MSSQKKNSIGRRKNVAYILLSRSTKAKAKECPRENGDLKEIPKNLSHTIIVGDGSENIGKKAKDQELKAIMGTEGGIKKLYEFRNQWKKNQGQG